MSKVYSNKALPAGTVLREWRLEEVLGVGGFGIVYKARGIYFDELVAIKEYFPSSISERQQDDTIVPVDSDAEEVHALGLKKFVEEAKLLWNLSTPSRHPNIVSVRSLFEIHGTAYMVMDFEDGVSLSKLLKDGTRFNQASLTALIHPIARGLERAHRVGVLHRDIKPPNILVGPDDRPVLIDFGSARFESGDATSTSVTFHTPPYAAIEQYVKTYEQGPWTDIYALGVVLYECVTGEKPAEVLERLHGNADKPLLSGDWPGFSRSFLAAIDAAMTIRPDERPRSISEWLEHFERSDDEFPPPAPSDEADEDATQVASFARSPATIVPVAPPAPGFETRGVISTQVPERPSQAEFKRAGEDTRGEAKADEDPVLERLPSEPPEPEPAAEPAAPAQVAPPPTPPKKPAPPKPAPAAKPKSRTPLLLAGVAALVLAAGGWYVLSGKMSGPNVDPELAALSDPKAETAAISEEISQTATSTGFAPMLLSLSQEAQAAGVPAAAVSALSAGADEVERLETEAKALPEGSAEAAAKQAEADAQTKAALAKFAGSLNADVQARSRKVAKDLPWTDPRKAGTGEQKSVATSLQRSRSTVQAASSGIGNAENTSQAVALARQSVTGSRAFSTALAQAYRLGASPGKPGAELAASKTTADSAKPVTSEKVQTPEKSAAPTASVEQSASVTPATRKEFDSVVSSAKGVAKQVIGLGDRGKPGSNATDAEKDGYAIRKQNAKTAKDYQDYLDTLSRSMKGTNSEAEARQSVAKARQTLSYLTTLLAKSKAAAP